MLTAAYVAMPLGVASNLRMEYYRIYTQVHTHSRRTRACLYLGQATAIMRGAARVGERSRHLGNKQLYFLFARSFNFKTLDQLQNHIESLTEKSHLKPFRPTNIMRTAVVSHRAVYHPLLSLAFERLCTRSGRDVATHTTAGLSEHPAEHPPPAP